MDVISKTSNIWFAKRGSRIIKSSTKRDCGFNENLKNEETYLIEMNLIYDRQRKNKGTREAD